MVAKLAEVNILLWKKRRQKTRQLNHLAICQVLFADNQFIKPAIYQTQLPSDGPDFTHGKINLSVLSQWPQIFLLSR